MKKSVLLAFTFLLATTFVLAAGSGTGGPSRATDVSVDVANIDCEANDAIRDRIKCRLGEERKARLQARDYVQDSDVVPEACRRLGVDSKERCRAFYTKTATCYERDHGKTRDECFKRAAGITRAKLDRNTDEGAVRNYIVAVLYNLEERIEDVNDEGKITDDEAADLLAQITDIKHSILNEDKTREEIRTDMQEFKQDFRSAIQDE